MITLPIAATGAERRSRTATVRQSATENCPDARRDRAPGPFGLQNELDSHSMIVVAPGPWFLRNSPVLRITICGDFRCWRFSTFVGQCRRVRSWGYERTSPPHAGSSRMTLTGCRHPPRTLRCLRMPGVRRAARANLTKMYCSKRSIGSGRALLCEGYPR